MRLPDSDGATGEKQSVSVKAEQQRLSGQAGLLIVAERRDFIRGCLGCWLGSACGEFTILAVPDVEASLTEDHLSKAAVALLGVATSDDEGWLITELKFLREKSASLPIVMLLETDETDTIRGLVTQFGIQGIIPNSSNMLVAAAAIHLVIAGGRYFPDERTQGRQPTPRSIGHTPRVAGPPANGKLTQREEAVLSLLGHGSQNKIIAHRLGMSISTTKAHVHSIIRKFGVQNRTEVVVAAQGVRLQRSRPDREMHRAVAPGSDTQPFAGESA